PFVSNILQGDADGDGRGDACDPDACGDGGDSCGPADDGTCPGHCDAATCRCLCERITDPRAKVEVSRDDGRVEAKVLLPLESYTGEAVTVTLADTGGGRIAATTLASLAAAGKHTWIHQSHGPGLQLVQLRPKLRDPLRRLQLRISAERWFDRHDADRSSDNTVLRVLIGGRCFVHPVTSEH